MNVPLKHILAPVDMSDPSARALRYASAWALATGARLSVLLAEEYELPPYLSPKVQAEVHAIMESERRYAKERLEAFSLPLVDPAVRPRFYVERGYAADRILAAARRLGADALVMGTHGRSGLRRLLVGSVTENVARRAPVPVLTVRAVESEAGVGGRSPWKLRRILVPVDPRFGPVRPALRLAVGLARDFAASLTVLDCFEPQAFALVDDEVGRAEERQRFFDRLPRDLRSPPFHLVQRGGDPGELVVREASSLAADLVVVDGAGALDAAAARILRFAPCPVLLVPGPARRPSRKRPAVRAGGVS